MAVMIGILAKGCDTVVVASGRSGRRGAPTERPFAVCQNTCSDVNPEPNMRCTNGCLTRRGERVYAARMAAREEKLTGRQRGILEVIETSMRDRGYPPSVREIGEAVGLTSPSSVAHQLSTLERKGFLRRDPNRPPPANRSVIGGEPATAAPSASSSRGTRASSTLPRNSSVRWKASGAT